VRRPVVVFVVLFLVFVVLVVFFFGFLTLALGFPLGGKALLSLFVRFLHGRFWHDIALFLGPLLANVRRWPLMIATHP